MKYKKIIIKSYDNDKRKEEKRGEKKKKNLKAKYSHSRYRLRASLRKK
jgi:hypothetical protein